MLPLPTAADAYALRTHCPYCAYQCGILLGDGDGRPQGTVMGDPHFPVNNGQLCIKGWTSHTLLEHPHRLLTPLVRAKATDELPDGLLGRRPSTWSPTSSPRRAESGPAALGVFGSGALTNEKAYLLGKFARVALGTPQHRLQRPLLHVERRGRGQPGVRHRPRAAVPVADIAQAEVVYLAGSNCADTLPPIMQWFDAQKRQRRPAHRRRPADDRHRPRRRPAPATHAGSDLALQQRPARGR